MINLKLIVGLIAMSVNTGGENGFFCRQKVISYNTGLLDAAISSNILLNNRLERLAKMIEMFNSVDASVICLQEVWIGADVKAIVDGVKDKFPYSLSRIHNGNSVEGFQKPEDGPVCDSVGLTAIFSCALINNCQSLPDIGSAFGCIFTQCTDDIQSFLSINSEACFNCFLTAFPNIETILQQCGGINNDGILRKMNTHGLLLLSRKPLTDAQSVDIFPDTKELISRGYLSAKVDELQIGCTHLSVAVVPFYGEVLLQQKFNFTSYAEQNFFETSKVISIFKDTKPLILLGDVNSGLAFDTGIIPRQEESYNALTMAFHTMPVSQCTFCNIAENPYNDDDDNYTIDHIFWNGVCVQEVRRIFTQEDFFVTFGSVVLPLSEHYGVEACID